MNRFRTIPYSKAYMDLAKNFDSGNSSIDQFLKSDDAFAKWFGKTFVWIDYDDIIGFYNIGVGYIRDSEYSNYKVGGAVHLNFFAVNSIYRNTYSIELANDLCMKTSDWLMDDLLERIEDIRNDWLGFAFITLNSTSLGYDLYKRTGFEELEAGLEFDNKDDEDECVQMYYCLDMEA